MHQNHFLCPETNWGATMVPSRVILEVYALILSYGMQMDLICMP